MKKFIDGLPEAPGIARRRRNEIGVVLFSGCQDELVVLVAQRLERGQIRSRVGAFTEVFSMPESRCEARRAGVNHGLDGDWRLVSLVMTGAYLSSKEDRVELYAMRREPSDFGGSVMS